MGGMETLPHPTLSRIADALDRCGNLLGQPIGAEQRARIFNAVESPTRENWADARSVIVVGTTTLWQSVVSTGVEAHDVPTGEQILTALEVD